MKLRHLTQADLHNTMELNPEKLVDYAMQLLDGGQPMEARAVYADICRLTPDDPEAWLMAAAISGDLGLLEESREYLQHALALDPAYADAHQALAVLLHRQSAYQQALQECDLALNADPDYAEAWLLKSAVLGVLGSYPEAVECARKTIALWPDCADAYVNMGQGLDALEQREAAIQQFRHALSLNPNLHTAHAGIADALVTLGRIEEAEASCAEAIKLAPADPAGWRAQARVLQHQGRNEEACQILEPMIAAGTLDASAAVTYARACASLKRPETAAPLIEDMLAQTGNNTADSRSKLHMAVGRLYDDMREYDRAFEHFHSGHRLKNGSFDPEAHPSQIRRLIDWFDSATLARLPRASVKSETPVFIVGMPRSGTTLVEQILASHPEIHGAGELLRLGEITRRLPAVLGTDTDYPACVSALTPAVADSAARNYLEYLHGLSGGSALRVTDKLPGNFMHLGLIELLFPGARIIHCMRDPLDTCVSCYSQNFSGHEYMHDLAHLGVFYREYRRLMQHWRSVLRVSLLEVQYESLIENPEAVSRHLIEFCGLPWDDSCLRFYENRRTVITASYDQVRRPIYTTSTERWRNYAKHLDPLRTALEGP